ncbi:hypothetical protein DD829_17880 [Chryseobacterium sp. HMWF035]|nr:hypothetical protein DD829_17880 [Chryseobacterium sp. HMWF035]
MSSNSFISSESIIKDIYFPKIFLLNSKKYSFISLTFKYCETKTRKLFLHFFSKYLAITNHL